MEEIVQIEENARVWLGESFDKDTKVEVERLIKEDKDELINSFYTRLSFGTGGLRGKMGVGTNKINKYTIGAATQGLANYLIKSLDGNVSVVIAHDSRNNSKYFSEVAAKVLSSNGISVYLFSELKPTPELSFAVRELKASAGIVITASHNPKEYNGYKVYWSDGGQLVSPHDKNVIEEVNKILDYSSINFEGDPRLIEVLEEDFDNKYISKVSTLSLNSELIEANNDFKIVYTPIHGTGVRVVPAALRAFGFKNIFGVDSQDVSDGNFPTVKSPNPEESEALSLAIERAREIDADLVLASDPDSDRVGLAFKTKKGDFQLINGNQIASILVYYVLNNYNRELNQNDFVAKTIVTSELLTEIAKSKSLKTYDVLTGFKYIAALIKELEGKETFIVGGEESFGYLVGDFVRDKDAVISCCMIAEASLFAKTKGLDLKDLLREIYLNHGFYLEDLVSVTKEGKKGLDQIKEMMHSFRSSPPLEIAGSKVCKLIDYQNSTELDLKTAKRSEINFPKSDVLQFFTENGSKVTVRPSGTEPKIKFYFAVNDRLEKVEDFEKLEEILKQRIAALKKAVMSF